VEGFPLFRGMIYRILNGIEVKKEGIKEDLIF
jgi:hypothetical protein